MGLRFQCRSSGGRPQRHQPQRFLQASSNFGRSFEQNAGSCGSRPSFSRAATTGTGVSAMLMVMVVSNADWTLGRLAGVPARDSCRARRR